MRDTDSTLPNELGDILQGILEDGFEMCEVYVDKHVIKTVIPKLNSLIALKVQEARIDELESLYIKPEYTDSDYLINTKALRVYRAVQQRLSALHKIKGEIE